MQKPLAELKRQCEEARALAALGDFKIWIECTSWAELHDADDLLLGQAYQRPLRLAHWRTLANLVGCNSVPRLRELRIIGCSNGDEGVQLLAAGVRQGCLPPLRALSLFNNQVGEEGASALASAVTESAMPSLDSLNVGNNRIGDAGLIALASALRRLPTLKHLWLTQNQISDVGLVNLLCHAATNGLKLLQSFGLSQNHITNEGCAAISAAILSATLPSLSHLYLEGIPATRPRNAQACRRGTPCSQSCRRSSYECDPSSAHRRVSGH